MPEQRRIKSVTELAKFRVGDVVWWIVLRPLTVPNLAESDQWMKKHHPKAFYEWGPGKCLWGKALLPKLQHTDFASIMPMLTSQMLTDQFPICDILRSRDTGEFFYSNADDEWMPESMLMDTQVQAAREKKRVMQMIKRWLKANE